MRLGPGILWLISSIHLCKLADKLTLDDEVVKNIEDLLVYNEEEYEDEEKEAAFENDAQEKFNNDYDGSDTEPLLETAKRFDSFFDQRAREKYLIQSLKPVLPDAEDDMENIYSNTKTKRNRESTLKQLIELCERSGEEKDSKVQEYHMNNIRRVVHKFSTAPVYGKRFNSILEQQNRAKHLLKQVSRIS